MEDVLLQCVSRGFMSGRRSLRSNIYVKSWWIFCFVSEHSSKFNNRRYVLVRPGTDSGTGVRTRKLRRWGEGIPVAGTTRIPGFEYGAARLYTRDLALSTGSGFEGTVPLVWRRPRLVIGVKLSHRRVDTWGSMYLCDFERDILAVRYCVQSVPYWPG